MQWFASNALLLTAADDRSVRLWSVERGTTLRTLAVPGEARAIALHPSNNNLVVVLRRHRPSGVPRSATHAVLMAVRARALASALPAPPPPPAQVGGPFAALSLFNLSTGKEVGAGALPTPAPVTALCFDAVGQLLFVGDDKVRSSPCAGTAWVAA